MAARFADQVVLVTGGSAGIGRACAQAFLAEGASRVYITGRRPEMLAAACAELGERATGVVCDVGKIADLTQLRSRIEIEHGRLHVIVANAGVAIRSVMGQTGEDNYATTFDTNVKGVFFTVELLATLLVDGGAIILMSSFAANHGRPDFSLYNASKAAIRSFARSFASDFKSRKIRVNAVSPGVIRTDIIKSLPGLSPLQVDEMTDQLEAYCREAAPAGRTAAASEVADAVLFLASGEASYINGTDLAVDGGMGQI